MTLKYLDVFVVSRGSEFNKGLSTYSNISTVVHARDALETPNPSYVIMIVGVVFCQIEVEDNANQHNCFRLG